jgi:hypothetical protein
LSHDEAEREAAKSVIAEARAQPRSVNLGSANPSRDGVTPANARAFLTNYLSALNAKLRNPITARNLREPLKFPRLQPRPYTHRSEISDPPAAVDFEPPPNPVLVFTGNATAAQLITDDEFHTSLHSVTTQTWRASIELNERRREERERRRSTWVG